MDYKSVCWESKYPKYSFESLKKIKMEGWDKGWTGQSLDRLFSHIIYLFTHWQRHSKEKWKICHPLQTQNIFKNSIVLLLFLLFTLLCSIESAFYAALNFLYFSCHRQTCQNCPLTWARRFFFAYFWPFVLNCSTLFYIVLLYVPIFFAKMPSSLIFIISAYLRTIRPNFLWGYHMSVLLYKGPQLFLWSGAKVICHYRHHYLSHKKMSQTK